LLDVPFAMTGVGATRAPVMLMTTASIAVAILIALLSGQSASDGQAYAIYQAKLSAMVATASSTDSGGASASAANPVGAATVAPGGCILVPGAGNLATTSDCTVCHSNYQAQHSHPVDVYQDAGRSRSLRKAAEVVRRGVFLADGKVTCLSCHDGNSKWKYKIALPPDAQTNPRVKPRDPTTYAPGLAVRVASTTMPAGSDVSPTPLCKACHGFD
jgi:hypothetical protein